MSWMLFTLLAALTWSVANIIDKYMLDRWIKNPITPLLIHTSLGLLAGIIIYTFHGYSGMSLQNIMLALVSGLFYILMCIFYFQAVKLEEISRIIPLFYLTPLFTMLMAAAFLGESLAPIKYIGVILLVVGAISLSSKNSIHFELSDGFWMMIMASFTYSINQIMTKYLLDYADYWTVFGWARIGAFISFIPFMYGSMKELASYAPSSKKKIISILGANEVLAITGDAFITIAASIGLITLVNALSSVQPLFVLAFAVILSKTRPDILKEEIGKSTLLKKLIAIVLMVAGAIIIS